MSLARDFVSRIGQKMQGPANPADEMRNIPENEVLILQPRIAGNIFIEGQVPAIRHGKNIFLSFRELCDTLAFPMKVDTTAFTARGWYIQEKFDFAMDLKEGFVQSRGQRFPVSTDEWFAQDGEVYILASSINKWMKVDSEFMWKDLLIDLVADQPFPLENKLDRRKRTLSDNKYDPVPKLPRADQPYEMATVPRVNATITNGFAKSPGAYPEVTRNARIETAGDLLDMTTRTFTTMNNQHGLDSFRFTMERETEDANMLGALHANRVDLGDLTPSSLPLAGQVSPGLGVRATNDKDSIFAGKTSRTFEGDVPPDWDVELYNGEQLISFQSVGNEGRYRFENVDLFAGDNDFRLVFYGPQGEVREEQIYVPVDISEVGDKKRLYDISLTMAQTQTYQYVPSNDIDRMTPQVIATYSQGVRDGLSVSGGFETLQSNEKQKVFANGGAALRLGRTLLNVDLVTDEELSSAWRAIARRAFGQHDMLASTIFRTRGYNPGNDEDFEQTKIENQFTVRGPVATLFGQAVSYSFTSNYSEKYINASDLNTRLSFNTRIGKYAVGESFFYSRVENEGGSTEQVKGSTTFRTSVGSTRLRGSIDYALTPAISWEQIILNAERTITKDVSLQAELQHDMDPKKTELTLSSNIHTDKYTITPRVSYNTDDELKATVSVNLGGLYDPVDKKFRLTGNTTSGQGAVHAFVYYDKDGNNIFDGKDEPLPDVRVMSVQVSRSAKTDKHGVALIADLPEYEATDVVVDTATLGDPYFVSGFEGSSIYPRPGKPVNMTFPVHMSGEMDGTVTTAITDQSGSNQVAGGLRMVLVNERGEVVMSTLTAFDGYYVFSIIPPGRYAMMVDSDDLKNNSMRQPIPQIINIGYDGKVLSGQDIRLESGIEVPIEIYKTEKGKPVSDQPIALNFGAYRSQLLAQVMKLRVASALRRNGLNLKVDLVATNNIKQPFALQSTLPAIEYSAARQVCEAAIEHTISCKLTVPARVLFDRATGNAAIATKPAKTQG